MPFGFGVNCEPSAVACLERIWNLKWGCYYQGSVGKAVGCCVCHNIVKRKWDDCRIISGGICLKATYLCYLGYFNNYHF